MSDEKTNNRYKIDSFRSKTLEGNPLNSPAERDLKIYLPPRYFINEDIKYPVIYFLHGYNGNNRGWTITSKDANDGTLPLELIPKKILEEIDLDRLPYFEAFDELINNGDLKPFIFVQPDGSLHIPHLDRAKDFRGELQTKGSFYVNSISSGNYMDYIIQDVIDYVENHYRTIPDKQHRALMGGSMGGFGTLYLCHHHPEKFVSAASLSPGNIGHVELFDWKLRIPIFERIFGKKFCEKLGDNLWADILDTHDLIYSNNNRLVPSIKRDKDGNIIDYNQEAYDAWQRHDLNNLIKEKPEALKNVNLLLNCEKTDEFGLTRVSERLHETLTECGIEHQFEIYSDPKAVLTPHMLGIGYKILPGIRFCLQYLS